MIKGIAHSAVTVKNMNESIRFYTKALGFHQAFELKNPETDAPWIVYLSICPASFWNCSMAAKPTIPGTTG